MDQKQITTQIMDSNKILLENTFVFVQTEEFLFHLSEKVPQLEARKKIANRYGKIYQRFYEDSEISAEHIMALYKIANQN
jgi:hypothetical protein